MNSTACFSRPALRPQSGNRDLSPVQSSRSIGLWEEIFSLSLRWINILHIGLLLISTWNQVEACVINTSVPLSWGIWRASWVSVFVCAQTNVPKWQVVSPLWSDNSSEMSTHQNTGRRWKKGDYSGWKAAAAKRGPCSSCVWLGINMKIFTRDSFELLHLCCKLRIGLYDKLANARSSIYQLLHPRKWCSTWLRFGQTFIKVHKISPEKNIFCLQFWNQQTTGVHTEVRGQAKQRLNRGKHVECDLNPQWSRGNLCGLDDSHCQQP